MKHYRHLFAVPALAVVGAGLAWVPAPAYSAPATCQGKAVTIVATVDVRRGTEGDDVVAMEPGSWFTFDALGGNDTICLAPGVGPGGSDPLPRVFLDAGAGDDTVVNLTPAGTTGIATTVVLGLGSDTFQGAGVGEEVYAEKQVADLDDPYAVDPTFVGPQTDVVSGAASVHSSAPNDAPNADRITFGQGAARVVLDGPMAPSQGSIDVSAATTAALVLRRPSALRASRPGALSVDAEHRWIAADVPLVWWTGEVDDFTIGNPLLRAGEPVVHFDGSPSSENVTFADVPMGTVSLGSGDDSLTVQALNHGYVPAVAYGGPGRDAASITAVCRELDVRIDRGARCDDVTGDFGSFHDVVATSRVPGSAVTVVGTGLRNRLVASGERVTVNGRGGADELGVDDSHRARVQGGAGADEVWASGDDVVVRGGAGADRIELQGSAGTTPVGRAGTPQQVALGGRGNDVLVGTTTRPDRLVGGVGKDRADGRRGDRDFCVAEVTRRCERP